MGKKSEQVSKEYAEFIEIAAHDLDAPLRKLSLLIDMMNNKYSSLPGEDVQSYIIRINTCITDMRALIDGLASLSHVISAPMQPEPINLKLLIDEIRDEMKEGSR